MGQPAYFAKSPIGVFAFSEAGELVHFDLFSRRPAEALQQYEAATVEESEKAYAYMRKNFRDYAVSLGFAENEEDLNKFLIDFFAMFSRKNIKGKTGRDKFLVQAINALDDIMKTANLLETRLYEWYRLHYPEVRNNDLVKNVIAYGRRENFPNFKNSLGVDLNEEDEKTLTEFSAVIKHLNEEKSRMDHYVRALTKETAPNLSSLIDELLVARLIAIAGSLEKMARMPASTIQLLGAEKALFRHLKKQGRSPKYGIIYSSSLIQNASKENKGKIARILSAKLMQAARIDFYSGRPEPRLRQELEKEVKQVK
ncbi:MAG: hypothetical protein NT120_03570 [Candidatus Aenigmarchaeota archaeon]|nr:hypothetical protein [Candidatus Aenigmarchaeota archaeon]